MVAGCGNGNQHSFYPRRTPHEGWCPGRRLPAASTVQVGLHPWGEAGIGGASHARARFPPGSGRCDVPVIPALRTRKDLEEGDMSLLSQSLCPRCRTSAWRIPVCVGHRCLGWMCSPRGGRGAGARGGRRPESQGRTSVGAETPGRFAAEGGGAGHGAVEVCSPTKFTGVAIAKTGFPITPHCCT